MAEAGRYETQGEENRGSVVAAAISRVAAASSVSGATIAAGTWAFAPAGKEQRRSSAGAIAARTEAIIGMGIPRGGARARAQRQYTATPARY